MDVAGIVVTVVSIIVTVTISCSHPVKKILLINIKKATAPPRNRLLF